MTRPTDHEGLQKGTSALVIARHIRNAIEAGELTDGQQLPSTRDLATEWKTSVATITRAMAILGEEGLVLNRARSSRIVNHPASAEQRPERSDVPTAILIGGYAGSGKSELGRILARKTGWPILDKDTTTRHVVEAALEALGGSPHDRESDLYLKTFRPAEYDALVATMNENLQCGVSAIATAPFIREFADQAWCDRLNASIDSMGGRSYVVWVRCDEGTMRMYLKHRGAARDAWKLSHWENYMAGVDLSFRPVTDHHIIDNSSGARPLQQQADELLKLVYS